MDNKKLAEEKRAEALNRMEEAAKELGLEFVCFVRSPEMPLDGSCGISVDAQSDSILGLLEFLYNEHPHIFMKFLTGRWGMAPYEELPNATEH